MDLAGASPLWTDLVLGHWRDSDLPAIVDESGTITGGELLERAGGAAKLLDDLGFHPGAAVPALMDETPTSVALVVGGALSARPVAPLGTKLPVDDLVHAMVGLGAHTLLASTERAELGRAVVAGTSVRLVVVEEGSLRRERPLDPRPAPDDAVVVVHTSGTTGRPKPVFQRQRQVGARVGVYAQALDLRPGDLYCSASPFYHTASVAMDVTVLAMGVGIIPQDWFSVDNWRRAGRLGATCQLLVPTMMDILLEHGALADSHPRVLQYGAMPIHPDTLRRVHEALPDTRLVQIFGQTEASPISCLDHHDHLRALDDRPDLLTSVGRSLPGYELAIEDPDDDGIGQVLVRGSHVFVTDDDGWRRTGDLGIIDAEGYLFLHGRVGDRIIRGGENIYPGEIELILAGHPGVREVVVVGVPDRRWGEIVKAVVAATDTDRPVAAEELRGLVAAKAARFKVPELIEFVDALPRTPSGKVQRHLLRGPADGASTSLTELQTERRMNRG